MGIDVSSITYEFAQKELARNLIANLEEEGSYTSLMKGLNGTNYLLLLLFIITIIIAIIIIAIR